MNEYCLECHEDTYHRWAQSVHAMSSFNNPAYAFSVRETRRRALEREQSNADARFCAGCHDPVPLLAGLIDDPRFDDPHLDPHDPIGAASISCTVCHSVVDVRGTRGNAEFTVEESPQYPFTFSESPLLRWVNRQLVKAKPSFHKRTYLKPEIHHTGAFCATCHKVFLPEELNDYRWLPGQNHWDSFRLSGVSGHGVASWNYPAKAETDCNGCHMPLRAMGTPGVLADFGAKRREGADAATVRDHFFPGANPAIACLNELPQCREIVDELAAFNDDAIRLDLFALRRGGEIDGELIGPLRPERPSLVPGERYLLEAVVRTLRIGHSLTQGTADSNELWLDVTLVDGAGRVVGRSGGMDASRSVDPWSRFFNVFMLDREGRRIDRRNPQDIFTPLYDHQIPPGAGDVTHLAFTVPPDAVSPITIEAAVRYRKFDTHYLRMFTGDAACSNDLPILTLATDTVSLPIGDGAIVPGAEQSPRPAKWERYWDYGIGLFRQGERRGVKGPLLQAEEAFAVVESLGRAEGAIGIARSALRDGRLDDAAAALSMRGGDGSAGVALVDRVVLGARRSRAGRTRRGDGESASPCRDRLRGGPEPRLRLLEGRSPASHACRHAAAAGVRGERCVGSRGKARRGANVDRGSARARRAERRELVRACADRAGRRIRGGRRRALAEHAKYKPDDNARDRAVALARQRYPAANHAAEPVVVYDLQREGAFGLASSSEQESSEVSTHASTEPRP